MRDASCTPAVSIIGGTGGFGGALALRLASVGVAVAIGSRDASRAAAAAAGLEERLERPGLVVGYDNPTAAGAASIVCLSVPLVAHLETLRTIRGALRPGAIVVDNTAPLATALGGRPTRVVGLWAGSAAEEARAALPATVRVLAAFHTIAEHTLGQLCEPVGEDVLICGDDADAKQTLAALVERMPGARAIDVGPLDMARYVEPLPALLISINRRYRCHAGIRLTGLPEGPLTGA